MLNWLSKTTKCPSAPRSAIGLMSGTSLDGFDACIVTETLDGSRINVNATHHCPLPDSVRQRFQRVIETGEVHLASLLQLEIDYTNAVIDQCRMLLDRSDYPVSVIGFHGQTLWHGPNIGSTLQIGFAELLAEATQTAVAHQFRRGDMARGGEGAPLAPLFLKTHFGRETENVCALNLGGIANLSILSPGQPATGWDLGPANTLSDLWHQLHQGSPFDLDGSFAASGHIQADLLEILLADPYFEKKPPKSTGREYFSLAWLEKKLKDQQKFSPADVQATLNQMTAVLVNQALPYDTDILVVSGGGIHNLHLMQVIDEVVQPLVTTSEIFSIDPDYVEAACFGWLGLQCLDHHILPTTPLTGSLRPGVLGSIVRPTKG